MTEQDLLDAAIEFHRAGRTLKAMTLFRRVLAFNPANHNALRLYGTLLRQAGQPHPSIPLLARAAALHPFVPVFHQDLQKSYAAIGRADLASASYCRALIAEIRAGLDGLPPPHPLGWPGARTPQMAVPRAERAAPLHLFLNERWFLLDPRRGASNCMLYAADGRAKTHPGTSAGFFPDEVALHHGLPVDRAFERAIADLDPDVVVWSPQVNDLLTALDPRVETVAALKRRHGFKLVVTLYDMADAWGVEPARPLVGLADLFVAMDLPPPLAAARLPDAPVLGMWAVADADLFFDDGGDRDIPVSFVGQLREARAAFLAQVQAAGLPVHRTGGQRSDAVLSYADYADVLRRSRMTINLPHSQTGGAPHVKARVFEALSCGTLLLEQANPATAHWLRPMEHYVPFDDAADLVAKARHYLEHPDQARAIAERGRDHVRANLDAKAFWRRLQAAISGGSASISP